MNALTRREYWDQGYAARDERAECRFDWREYVNHLLVKKIEGLGLDGKRVLEIGAGDSAWLPYFARRYPGSRFAGLDYSEAGCARLAKRAAGLGRPSAIEVHHQDMFAADSALHGQFDLVMSFGVVEHFADLAQPLAAKRRYLADGGTMFTLIPNMAGVIGRLTKRFNRAVYDMHNPHDWESFLDGHRRAGLAVSAGGYLGSSNFGVLSSCFTEPRGAAWHTYVLLTRLSKAVWFLESRFGDLPASRTFSPYIVAASRAT
jgi:2-polyprenyl-3-methyl-5-hydroxy-6-metoxy-1,4-benzoquinol methylase